MSVIQLVCEVPQIYVEVIVGLGGLHIMSRITIRHEENILTSYCVQFIRSISLRMSFVESSNGGGEL
jgi:hypothetical protein